MPFKKFKIKKNRITNLITSMGGCFATDSITVDGCKVRVMIRDEPSYDNDSGWFFMSGQESQEYIDNPNNIMIYEVNTIANYDQDIIPYLNYPVGVRLERCGDSNEFIVVKD